MMEWFIALPTEVQVPIVGLAGSIIAIAGAWVKSKLSRNPAREREYKRPPLEVKLSDADRALIDNLKDSIDGHASAIGKHHEEIGRHREELIRNPPAGRPTRPRGRE